MSIILVLIVVFIIYSVVVGLIESRKQSVRDGVARNILKNFNFEKEKQEILSINENFISAEMRCPKCNGMLVCRIGKFGQFWGCSRYPACRFTKNV